MTSRSVAINSMCIATPSIGIGIFLVNELGELTGRNSRGGGLPQWHQQPPPTGIPL